jgi:hypothetical protein
MPTGSFVSAAVRMFTPRFALNPAVRDTRQFHRVGFQKQGLGINISSAKIPTGRFALSLIVDDAEQLPKSPQEGETLVGDILAGVLQLTGALSDLTVIAKGHVVNAAQPAKIWRTLLRQ